MRSFFDASEFVTEDEFKLFAQDMLNTSLSVGLNEVGFAKYVDFSIPQTFQSLPAQTQAKISQLDHQGVHAPVIYIASQKASSTQLLMQDTFDTSQLKLSADMKAAALHDKVVISQPIGLYSEQAMADFSMILPVYNMHNQLPKNSMSIETNGWIFLNLDMRAIYASVFMEQGLPEVNYRLYQQVAQGTPQILFESVTEHNHPSIFSSQQTINVFGKEWTLVADSLMPFEKTLDYSYSNTIGLLGVLISTALMGVLYLLAARLRTFDHLKAVNHQLKLSEERWHFALEGSGDGIWDWDIANDKIEYSKSWHALFGYAVNQREGTFDEWEKSVHHDDRHLVTRALNTYLRGEAPSYSLEYRLKCNDGSWKWILSRGMVVAKNVQGEPLRMVGTHTDISQLKESEEQIWQHANFDHLTSLPNRRMLYSRLDKELHRAKHNDTQLALLFLDLDGFKEINDNLGHDQGDVLLQQASERLTASTYTRDVVARLGGDEFVILVTNLEEHKVNEVELIAQKVLSALSAPFTLNNEHAFVTASIGIVVYPDDSSSIDGLIKKVDQAMYASKDRGGNCFTYFTLQMQENSVNRLRLSNDLRLALDRQELFVEYQPIVELNTGKVYKAEALLRWQHPEKGFISPAEFIPIAEDTRLINEIGNWVFMESIKQCKAWREEFDERFQIAVNKSPVQFMNADPQHSEWVDQLPTDFEESNIVVIEITEGLLLESSEHVGNKLDLYRGKGIQIALDDFGTGYSSLSYLRKFDFDYLKIDRSFVANLEDNAEDRVLCKAIIDMAHSLGVKVVAEGVETEQQRDWLLEYGCDYGQGWYYAKSLPAADFERFVKDETNR